MRRLPTYFISHGGGPWPYLPDMAPVMAKLKANLESIVGEIGRRPRALLVITGHWEQPTFTVSSSPNPPMVYDYGGFPAYTYQIHYDAPGCPELAERVTTLLHAAGIAARSDPQRGFDHGTFAPLAVMYPDADVPVVQLSLQANYDPASHLAAGRAIAPLRDDDVLILGSGLSYHNLAEIGSARAMAPSRQFDAWLDTVLTQEDTAARSQDLIEWTKAPAARQAHPQEDHLLPLMVAVGAAENEAGERIYHEPDFFGSIAVSNFRFGSLPASP